MRNKVVNVRSTGLSLNSLFIVAVILAAVICLFSGAAANAQAAVNPQPASVAGGGGECASSDGQVALSATSMVSVLTSGDVIDIQVFNTPELSGRQEISEKGLVRLPYSGPNSIVGMSPYEAGLKIERCLGGADVLKDHQVTVVVFEHARGQFAVLGEVNHPGTYTFQRAPTLATALALAGGVTARAGKVITVTGQNGKSQESNGITPDDPAGDKPTLIIQPSDVITVSQIGTIYVIGDVNRPGEYNLSNLHLTYAPEAVALAQGLKQTARPSKASIIRTDPKGGYIATIPVDLSNPRSSLTERTVLQPLDIIVVPTSAYREFEFNFLPGLTGAAANAIALALVAK
jgi:polysaccharide export outer membrane protein